jgi:hypothetical protein
MTAPDGRPQRMNFFSELKRRNVYKVAVAYIVVGWALSQGIAQVFPVFDVPNWVIRLIVVLIIVGLPIALALAWMFELTPQGIKRTETADAMPQATQRKKYVWIYVVVIGGLVSIGLFFIGRYSAGNKTASPAGISNKSIAVLPFDNLSRDPENAYFSEGIQEEILTRLAKVADLKVISRTSTQQFQKHARKSSPDREATWRDQRSGRQRAESERPGAGECAADQCAHRRSSLGRDLRSQTHRHLRGRKRNRENSCRDIAGKADGLGEKLYRQSADRESGSLRALSQGQVLFGEAERRGLAQSDRVF